MFGSNKNKKVDNDQELMAKINQELLVRNMPSIKRLNSGPASSPQVESGGELLSSLVRPKHNFKAVGVLIIFGGLILITGLVYLSYVFIIKPQAGGTTAPVATQAPKISSVVDVINGERATTTAEIPAVVANSVATITPITLDLATSSASSTLDNSVSTGNQSVSLSPLLDSDGDGLNDDEEKILGTDFQMADSNSNGYPDLTEINNNYNPIGTGKLSANLNLAKYTNQAFSYEILYPKDWSFSSLSGEATTVFSTSDNSLIQISVQENTDKQSILGWYGNTFPEETITYDNLKSVDNWDGIWGSDNLNFYLTDKARANIYVVSFISAIDGRVAYPNIFKLMINSLSIK